MAVGEGAEAAAEDARLAETVRQRLADPRPSLSFEEAATAMGFDPKDFDELSSRARETWDADAYAAYDAARSIFDAEGQNQSSSEEQGK